MKVSYTTFCEEWFYFVLYFCFGPLYLMPSLKEHLEQCYGAFFSSQDPDPLSRRQLAFSLTFRHRPQLRQSFMHQECLPGFEAFIVDCLEKLGWLAGYSE